MNDVSVIFQSKHPHRTLWLRVGFPEGQPPDELLTALAEIGWKPYYLQPLIPLGGREYRHIGKDGTGLFNGWTPREKRRFLAEAAEVLERFGFDPAELQHQRLSMADCL